jgi:glutamate dehydrogenase/leucine dehydrogenase
LQERGILYAPDYVINLGGAMGLVGLERLGWTRAEADQHVASAVAEALGEVYALADREHTNTFAAAQRIVEQRLREDAPAL